MSVKKITSLTRLKPKIAGLKKAGKKIVFTNGCFDLLHYGHVMYLEKAKAKGDILIVALNSDSSVRRIKGSKRPVVKQNDRARVIAGLESVDFVTIFSEDTPLKAIKALKPDIIVKGSDWAKKGIVGKDTVTAYGGRAVTIPLAGGRSTTDIINRVLKIACG